MASSLFAALRSSARKRPLTVASISVLTASVGYAVAIEKQAEIRETQYLNFHNNSDSNLDDRHNDDIRPTTTTTIVLPRKYDLDAIENYWSHRPISVVRRVAEIVTVLSPLLLAYVRDFKLNLRNDDNNNHNKEGTRRQQSWDNNDDDEMKALSSSLLEDMMMDEKERRQQLQRQHAHNLRDALTRLGPAFIKMGQQLSIRPDLVPPAVLAELQTLCDNVEPVPDAVALEVLRTELGFESQDELSTIFTGLRRVASASLGQVYKATLATTNGTDKPTEVAIKVQRPDMVKRLSLDLFLLQNYGRVVDAICKVLTEQIPYHANFINAFAKGSYMELDYENEAANQLRFKSELEKRRCNVIVPDVLSQYTTRKVICMEWIEGTKLVDSSGEQIRTLIPVGVELFLTQLLDIGAFHADPHPANLYVTKDGHKLCLLDFGLCAEIDERSRRAMTAAIVNLLSGNFNSLIEKDAKDLGFLDDQMDVTELKPILTKILTKGLLEAGSNLHDRKRKLMDISNELNDVFFRYPFSVPPFFALITRGLGLLEGIALSGDPDFDIFKASLPYATKRAMEIFGSNFLSSASGGLGSPQRRPTAYLKK